MTNSNIDENFYKLLDDKLEEYASKFPADHPLHPGRLKQHYPETPAEIRKYADEVEEYNKQVANYEKLMLENSKKCKIIYAQWMKEVLICLEIESHSKIEQLFKLISDELRNKSINRDYLIEAAFICRKLSVLLR